MIDDRVKMMDGNPNKQPPVARVDELVNCEEAFKKWFKRTECPAPLFKNDDGEFDNEHTFAMYLAWVGCRSLFKSKLS